MNFTYNNFVFFLMSFGMYILMFIGGNRMKYCKTEISYWKYATIPMVAFTLNMGLRWGRGTDYNNGYYTYDPIIKGYVMIMSFIR